MEGGTERLPLAASMSSLLVPVFWEPMELLEKLSALVPAPRAHLVRYSGVLAPASKWRPLIVPEPPAAASLSMIPPDTAHATQRSRASVLDFSRYGCAHAAEIVIDPSDMAPCRRHKRADSDVPLVHFVVSSSS